MHYKQSLQQILNSKNWKQPKFPTSWQCFNNSWYTSPTEHYAVIKLTTVKAVRKYGGKTLPWGAHAQAQHSLAFPQQTAFRAIQGGSCHLTWFPSFPWETTRRSACQVSYLCFCPLPRGAQVLATWVLIPRALNMPSYHWAFHPPTPQSQTVWPLEPMRCYQQNPCISNFTFEPYLVTLTQWWGSILKMWNVSHQNDWVLLLPGWWDLMRWV